MRRGPASLFAGIRRSSLWSLLEDSGETSFSNRNDVFRFEEEKPPSDTEFSQYYGSAETERATCASTWFPGRVFAFFRRAAKEGRSPQERNNLRPNSRPRRSGQTPVPVIAKPVRTPAVAIRIPVQSCVFAVCHCALFSLPVASGGPRRSTRRSLRFRRTVILRKLRIARWLLLIPRAGGPHWGRMRFLFKSKHIISI